MSMSWLVNVREGTSVMLKLKDGDGKSAYTGAVTVGKGNVETCLAPDLKINTPSVNRSHEAQSTMLTKPLFYVNRTSLTQCKTTHVTWTGGKGDEHPQLHVTMAKSRPSNIAPFTVDAIRESNSDILAHLGEHNGTSTSWNTNVKAGTNVVLRMTDPLGQISWSNSIIVGKSSDSSCL